ncbi:conserved hypothetical protein [Bathymodiolus platifrons methanotrophic gill symbiont]|uniref:hypothetical protein n=1 Tax=Bathymodiolus platifrons methanotrophic gill symbiont TaxID=113268 RepID=UPI000B62ED2C|nr:hypothetical protein [Bathymodiolus platifrons methanotrophic gill symbiont]GAW87493.1 conserved hypothetical protein [Bathymodiolus platifrons methanotrophic gill symbiont]
MKMKKCKKYGFIILSALLLTAVTAYAITGWRNEPLDKTEDEIVVETNDVPKGSIKLANKKPKETKKKGKPKPKPDKHNHDVYEYDEELNSDGSLAGLPADVMLEMMEEGVSIVSYEDQPIPQLFKDMTKKAVEEMEERGYASAEESEVRDIARVLEPHLKHLMLPYEEAANQLATEPANLEATPFTEGELIGAHISGSYQDGKWTNISRFYKFNDLGLVKFFENDYVTSRGSVQMAKELINEEVNGVPAIYRVNVSNSGAALTLVSWATDSKDYELSVEKNGAKDVTVRQRLLELARSVPVE